MALNAVAAIRYSMQLGRSVFVHTKQLEYDAKIRPAEDTNWGGDVWMYNRELSIYFLPHCYAPSPQSVTPTGSSPGGLKMSKTKISMKKKKKTSNPSCIGIIC